MPAPPIMATWSPTSTWPAIITLLASTQLLPRRESCPTWALTISRLLSPTVVRPPPFSVPRWTVTASRKTLPLPTVSLVRAPLYFLSCGAPPITVLGKKTLSRPIVVSPRIVTLLSSRQPGPILTSGPITQNGPISTASPISAFLSTTACGAILGRSSEKKRKVNRELNHAGRLRGVGRAAGAAGAAGGGGGAAASRVF